MTGDQIASLAPRLSALLGKFRHCFERENTVKHWETYLLGLMANLDRKSIEPIALAAGKSPRTLQEFMAFFRWDEERAGDTLMRLVADEHAASGALGVIDASGHAKQGDKTPGVQRQYCGETGKIDNCVVGQHLLYTDNDPANPFCCMLASDLFLPEGWSEDCERCREAGIPDEVLYRAKYQIALDQIRRAAGNGVRFAYVVFDEDYGRVPAFWFGLDDLGQRGIGEVPANFMAWTRPPRYASLRKEYGPSQVKDLVRYSPDFYNQPWQTVTVREGTRGPVVWKVKTARIRLPDRRHLEDGLSVPTDREYWLIVTWNLETDEIKYWVSNAPAGVSLVELLRAAFGRWHVEKWFEWAKQEAGLGAFEVRTYKSLMRHWLSSRIVMMFLACETERLRGEKYGDHAGTGEPGGEPVGVAALLTVAAFAGGAHRTERVLSAP